MLAGALCRLAADVPRASPHNVPQLARHLERVLVIRSAAESSPARASPRIYAYARCYATTTRATKPTATVKKAVKAAASEKTPPKKKAAPAKTTAKKPAAKKTKKPAAKKPAAKKAAPKRAKKKVLTEEEKERAKIRQLRAKALKEPLSQRTLSAYNLFVAELTKGKPSGSDTQVSKITSATKEFKNLSPAQLEHYNHLANEENAKRKAEFDKWLQSYTPQEIRIANLARAQLRRRLAGKQKGHPAHSAKLHDPRHVKATLNPYALFSRARHATGDFKGIPVIQASKLIGAEWKSLNESEKQKYQSEANALATKQ
ncbi:hypothetical protein COCMIDRAFT_82655 [Bipolaris oryzae ATCC 44560]|uniref:HMG box domain-containing protein n=1 Tax=Bipolaris oryzae ATCC 44560 TaxID=930090 RepID=W6ZJM1_COCMI|nr:uncharacterized protein COCMIDRAFT_82655 [Bipolaris oryzae ATCC 44560]EUC50193.1 hypothetical protein COCMIDRAFT_82655 [Bipolaris oryzae ATCC 44560]